MKDVSNEDTLIDVLNEVVNADHFSDDLYQRVFRALRAEKKTSKLHTRIANTLEEYYNLHNLRSVFRGHSKPIPPEAEDEREDLKLCIEALRQGIQDFRSLKDLRSKVQQKT